MTLLQMAYLALIFIAVTAAVLGIGVLFTRRADVRSRLRTLVGASVLTRPEAGPGWSAAMIRLAHPVARLATPDAEEDISRLRARFLHAGFRHAAAPVLFFAAKSVLALLLPIVFIVIERSASLKLEGNTALMLLLLFAGLGYYLPNMVLGWFTRVRQREIFEAFPDAIDLMIVCVEAGLGLDMAINRAATEMRLRSVELADELDLVAVELRVGASRERALRNFAVRTGLDEVASFVSMLLQADRFGTSLADSLRVHADSLRTRRRLRAEEAAAKIALKLLFPLIFFIFPSLLVVLMGPAMIQIYRIMLPSMAGAQ